MKKRIATFLIAIGYIISFAFSAYADPIPLGDVDFDGEITASDARLALRASVALEKFNKTQELAADADKDGTISANDARMILRASVELEKLENPKTTTITVYTSAELVKNIKSNTKIILASQTYVLPNSLSLNGINNLSIEGNAEIILEDIMQAVIKIKDCKNIELNKLTIGHIEPLDYYHCEGDVIEIENSSNILIKECNLFGCGSIGVSAYDTKSIKITDSNIYDCTFAALSLHDSQAELTNCSLYDLFLLETGAVIISDNSAINLTDCSIYATTSHTLIDNYSFGEAPKKITFNDCFFANNNFFNIIDIEENINFKNCVFDQNTGFINASKPYFTECVFFDNTYYYYLNTPEAPIRIDNIFWSCDFLGGISPTIEYTNQTDRQIAYIHLYLDFYDRMGNPAYCEIQNTYKQALTITGPINANESYYSSWDSMIYHNAVGALMPSLIEIEFTDGTKASIFSDGTFWYSDDYYGGPLNE